MNEYKIQVQDHSFKLILLKNEEDDVVVKIGSQRRDTPCVVLEISSHKPNIVNIEYVEHDEFCADNKLLERKRGTRLMLYVILDIVLRSLPEVKYVTLQDISKFYCHGHPIELANYKMLTEGITHYQNVFPTLKPTIDENIIQENLQKLQQVVSITLDTLIDSLITEKTESFWTSERQSIFAHLHKNCYKKDTWLAFFKALTRDPKFGCLFFAHHIGILMDMLTIESLYWMDWVVGRDAILPVSGGLPVDILQIEPATDFAAYLQGGRKGTAKHRKRLYSHLEKNGYMGAWIEGEDCP